MTTSVTSTDGTSIAYDLLGAGASVIVVGGATCDRAKTADLAEELARHYRVVNYDRRGRGDSGDTLPYAVDREVEDLASLIEVVGGAAALYGHSSGAGLVLHATAAGLPATRAILHEPPYSPESMAAESRESGAELTSLIAQGRKEEALKYFLTMTGAPPELVAEWHTEPWWASTVDLAHTLAYDSQVMGDTNGGTVPLDLAAATKTPTLVLVGDASPPWMIDTDRALAEALPSGRLQVLPGEEHVVPPKVLVPVLREFLEAP